MGAVNNTLSAINGLKVGHYTDLQALTGCTVILCPPNTVAGVDVRGAAPGTRETALLHPLSMMPAINGILLTGGSAFGLSAAAGVMRWLEERGQGFNVGVGVVPIVPGAVLFDLLIGRADVRPGPDEGYAACQNATNQPVIEGSVGAGTGATVGKLFGPQWATKAGIGSACQSIAGGIKVAALVALNAFGDIINPANQTIIAGARNPAGPGFANTQARLKQDLSQTIFAFGQNTTLAVIATNASLDKTSVNKVAQMAHNGLAQTISPVHTQFDGDTVFALATGEISKKVNASVVGAIAAETLTKAVIRAVEQATGLGGLPAAGEL